MKLILSLILLTSSSSVLALDCTHVKTQQPFKTRCSRVLDPIKLKTGEISFVNCLGGLEDGYTARICKSVDLGWQLKKKKKTKSEKLQPSA